MHEFKVSALIVLGQRYGARYEDSARYFGLKKQSNLKGIGRKSRYSAVKSSQLSWSGQYKKCAQYNFKFTSVYSVGRKIL